MSNTDKNFIPFKIRSNERATSENINDFNVYINQLDQIHENYEIHLRNFTMNNDMLNINSLNNSIGISQDIGTTSIIYQNVPLVITEQNYNSTQFTTEFNTQAPLQGITGLSATFNTQNNLLTYTNSTGTDLVLNINENQKYLGLSEGTHPLLDTDTLISDQPADFSGPKEINVILENIPLESYTTQNFNKNILATIPVNVAYNERLIYSNDYPVNTNTKNINRLHIRLTDEFDDPIQCRSDYIMNLQFIDTQTD